MQLLKLQDKKLFLGEICYLLFNVYLNSDCRTIKSLIEYIEKLTDIEEKIADEEYDELIRKLKSGHFNSGPNNGRFWFLKDLKCFIDNFEFVCPDIGRLSSASVRNKPKVETKFVVWLRPCDHFKK